MNLLLIAILFLLLPACAAAPQKRTLVTLSPVCHIQTRDMIGDRERYVKNLNLLGEGTFTCADVEEKFLCENLPGACAREIPPKRQQVVENEPWCSTQPVQKGMTEQSVRAKIRTLAQAQGKVIGDFTCSQGPYSLKDPTRYFKCESAPGACNTVIRNRENRDALVEGIQRMQEETGEGWYTEWPSGKRLWCDSANGCQPRFH